MPRTQATDRPTPAASNRGRRAAALALRCLLAGGPLLPAQAAPPQLSVDNEVATAGVFRLSWEADAGRVELQEAADPAFQRPKVTYRGPDRATVISGKPDGTWYYRVRSRDDAQGEGWSEPLAVSVEHHSLSRALLFLSLGILVFVATVAVILRGPVEAE